jgi:hypothetical protein
MTQQRVYCAPRASGRQAVTKSAVKIVQQGIMEGILRVPNFVRLIFYKFLMIQLLTTFICFSFLIFFFTQLGNACEAGKYDSTQTPRKDSTTACTDCIAGKYSSVSAAHSSTTCLDCDKGFYRIGSGANHIALCLACKPGKFSAITQRTTDCKECDVGYFSETPGATVECEPCPSGYSQKIVAQPNCAPCVRLFILLFLCS